MGFNMEAMFVRLLGEERLRDVRETPLCELRARLSSSDRAYGGLAYADRSRVLTSEQINALVDCALSYKK